MFVDRSDVPIAFLQGTLLYIGHDPTYGTTSRALQSAILSRHCTNLMVYHSLLPLTASNYGLDPSLSLSERELISHTVHLLHQ